MEEEEGRVCDWRQKRNCRSSQMPDPNTCPFDVPGERRRTCIGYPSGRRTQTRCGHLRSVPAAHRTPVRGSEKSEKASVDLIESSPFFFAPSFPCSYIELEINDVRGGDAHLLGQDLEQERVVPLLLRGFGRGGCEEGKRRVRRGRPVFLSFEVIRKEESHDRSSTTCCGCCRCGRCGGRGRGAELRLDGCCQDGRKVCLSRGGIREVDE